MPLTIIGVNNVKITGLWQFQEKKGPPQGRCTGRAVISAPL